MRWEHRFWISFAAAMTMLLGGCGKREEVVVGYEGKARAAPFLAAQETLEELGYSVHKEVSHDLGMDAFGTIFATAADFSRYGDANEVLRWVRNGGNLVLFLNGGDIWQNDFERDAYIPPAREPSEEEVALLKMLGIKPSTTPAAFEGDIKTTRVNLSGKRLECELAGKIEYSSEPPMLTLRAEGPNANGIAGFRKGSGLVTVFADAHPFRNRFLVNHDNAELLETLAALGNSSLVLFYRGKAAGSPFQFFRMLWEKGKMALMPLILILLVWLWRHMPRFGPVETTEAPASRDFLTHLKMTGAFLWRHKLGRELLGSVQRSARLALERQGWHTANPEWIRRIAIATGLPEERVRYALTATEPTNGEEFERSIRDLQRIREKF